MRILGVRMLAAVVPLVGLRSAHAAGPSRTIVQQATEGPGGNQWHVVRTQAAAVMYHMPG